ncbi:hypothetical protein LJR267_002855 [Paraburkholderia hospita]|uniref:hypothetical protein n=1 Tax=Paraburkholderia hospita TaxID=169430 RepID=UPI003ED0CABF
MTKRCFTCGRVRSNFFIPTQAILGYPNQFAKKPAVAEHRRRYTDFSRKLHAVLAPLLGERYSLHEELTVLTSAGLAGPSVRADCVALTDIGVFVISHIDWAGKVGKSLEEDKLRVETAPGMTEFYLCPLRYTAPAVHFLGALLDGFDCPIESIAVFESDTCQLETGLSTSLLKLSELHHFIPVRHERADRRSAYLINIREMGERLRTGCRLITGPSPSQLEADATRSEQQP